MLGQAFVGRRYEGGHYQHLSSLLSVSYFCFRRLQAKELPLAKKHQIEAQQKDKRQDKILRI